MFLRKKRSFFSRFFKFVGLSGLGWLLDVAMLLALVKFLSMDPAKANYASSICASTTVFLISREFIFRRSTKYLFLGAMLYIYYAIVLISIASTLLGIIIEIIRPLAKGIDDDWRPLVLSATAKIIVTPPQLVINFLVSRYISEYRSNLLT